MKIAWFIIYSLLPTHDSQLLNVGEEKPGIDFKADLKDKNLAAVKYLKNNRNRIWAKRVEDIYLILNVYLNTQHSLCAATSYGYSFVWT